MEYAYTRGKTRRLAGTALFTAIVVVLQLLGSFIRFGPFSISAVALPIVIGAAVYGTGAGLWLGLVFGFAVLFSGDAGPFLAVTPLGTVLMVLLKGGMAGLCAGGIYSVLLRKNEVLAGVAAAVVFPVVNTGLFLASCPLLYLETVSGWAQGMGFGENVGAYLIFGLVGANFLIELGMDIVLIPVILRLIRLGKKERHV